MRGATCVPASAATRERWNRRQDPQRVYYRPSDAPGPMLSMRQEKRCISCGLVIGDRGTTSFPCPSCGGATIGRCRQCRDQGVAYQCPACGFRGP